jgi:beta-glucosidase
MPINPRPLSFPKNFVWGFAAAAPQIEGAAFLDGKGESVWDRFSRQPGAVTNGDTLDVACDHYHRYDADFKLMRDLGAKHYRLSLAWPRILPDGDGAVNQKGLDFYHRLFDSMEKHELTPWVTMFHWDLPQALETRYGGWRDRRVSDAFARYADVIVQAFGDRVKNWITLNEITCFTYLGYGNGQKAPGLKLSDQVVNQTYHHALLCHGHGVRAVREFGGRGARVGLTDNSNVGVPVTETEADIAAVRKHFVEANWKTIDAMYRGHYDPAFIKSAGKAAPKFAASDFKLISLPTDFLGMNIYTGAFIRASKAKPGYENLPAPPSYPQADAAWLKIMPQSLYWGPRLAAEIYGVKAIYITENGCGYNDAPPVKGEVLDLHRRDLVRNYLGELRRGIQDGVPTKGYFLWSFMDNYEWEDGYARRFGVVYCDFKTQKRTPKLSAKWFSRVIAENRLV